ncbi:MAG TPA: tail fiber protein [Haloplasmataceae bacterium]
MERLKRWFFTTTNQLRADGTTGGVRFKKTDKPTQTVMEDLCDSIPFKLEKDDRAKIYTGSADLSDEVGLVVLATDAQAKANASQLADRSLVVQPHQLPTIENLDVSPIGDMPTSTLTIDTETTTTTRNRFRIRLSSSWITWLISRIFKSGGVEGDVPIKTNSDDYNWSWGNIGDNKTTVEKIAINSDFVTKLLANTTFVNNLVTQIITNSSSAITEALEVGFIRIHPVNSSPSSKWLPCDGSEISRTTYADLFSLIGTTYGIGDGSTTFNLPNFNDRQIMGSSGTKTVGSVGGSDTHTLIEDNLPSHNHSLSGDLQFSGTTDNDGAHGHTLALHDDTTDKQDKVQAAGVDNESHPDSTDAISGGAHSHNFSGTLTLSGNTGSTGSGTPVNHLDPYIAVKFLIKVLK